MNQLMFKNLSINQQFRFAPRQGVLPTEADPNTYQKVSDRKYKRVLTTGALGVFEFKVGTVNVKVEDWK